MEISQNKHEHIHKMKEFNRLERSHSSWKQDEKQIVHIQPAHGKHLKLHKNFSSRKRITLYYKMN